MGFLKEMKVEPKRPEAEADGAEVFTNNVLGEKASRAQLKEKGFVLAQESFESSVCSATGQVGGTENATWRSEFARGLTKGFLANCSTARPFGSAGS